MATRTDSRAQPRPRAEVPVHPGTLRLDSESSNRNSRRLGRPNSWDIASRRNFLNLEGGGKEGGVRFRAGHAGWPYNWHAEGLRSA
jgi:hypothetical protein